MSAKDKKDFDKIVLGRSTQVEKSVEHCCHSAMKKMESLLRALCVIAREQFCLHFFHLIL